ncbi:MAG: hypothetical protein WC975_10335 [Phycisphaerae bacterium]
MHMHWIDWLIMAVPMLIVAAIGIKTQRHIKGVSDFMTGGRAAGRYLLTTSEFVAGMGLVTAVAMFEASYQSGFAYSGPWGVLLTPLFLALTLTGYLIYRYRETRVMTMAQFFEVRYSKRFRVFTGFLAASSGILNYGIFPAVGGRFFVYFCGLPEKTAILGHYYPALQVPTFAIIMFIFLSVALVLIFLGGQLTILVTDAVQAIFCYLMFAVVSITILFMFSKSQMMQVLEAHTPGKSFINPWDIDKLQDFNLWFWLIGTFGGIYAMMAWQGTQGFNASAASPHEAKMGKILATFRSGFSGIMFTVVILAAMVYLNHPNYAAGAQAVHQELARIDNAALRTQLMVPIALAHLLPPGIKGCFCAIMLFLLVTTDVSYLHSWGSILVQDCVLPFRKKPFSPKTHIRLICLAITAVTLYAFVFSLLFYQTTYILMFFALTATIYLGGAGACIVGGLYWKKGTAAGAWGAMLTGAVLAVLGFIGDRYWTSIHPTLLAWFPGSVWLAAHGAKFPINGQWIWGIAMIMAIAVYVLLSLLTCRADFNLNRMLHRGQYAVDAQGNPLPRPETPPLKWRSFIGIDPDMSLGDKRLTYFTFSWTYFWWLVGMVILVWNLVPAWRWTTHGFAEWFFFNTYTIGIVLGLVTTVWFTWGGIRDLRRLFVTLRTQQRNVFDDGRVVDHHNAGEILTDASAEARLPKLVEEKESA